MPFVMVFRCGWDFVGIWDLGFHWDLGFGIWSLPLRVHPWLKVVQVGALIGSLFLAATAHAKLNVIVTTPDLASIAQEIGGNNVEITTLAKPTEDPHFVDAKPSFILKLSRADAVVEGQCVAARQCQLVLGRHRQHASDLGG